MRSFHAHLPLDQMQCEVLPDQPAAWLAKVGGKTVRLSKEAADILVEGDKLKRKNLTRHKPKPVYIENNRWDPATAVTSSLLSTSKGLVAAASGIVLASGEVYRQHQVKPEISVLASAMRQSSTITAGPNPADAITSAEDLPQPSAEQDVADADGGAKPEKHTIPVGQMIGSSALSIAKVPHVWMKGMLVDMPHAAAEGFRRAPELWGEEASDCGRVTDWKSGFLVAGKSFVQGIGEGGRDLVMRPAKGAQKEGFLGAAKGVAIGTGSLVTKTVSGSLGLVAYPGHGITKSLYSTFHGATRKKVVAACYAEGQWRSQRLKEQDWLSVENRFTEMTSPETSHE
ncbi:hypothetical protein Slin15195_G100540 [Septoria linicola]|uniref:Uncharacterized protein n=1 Tax=Septoria linicola TaxID=215465 RepID=A0A9Q9AX38_9PEZI|nr:hypothetical protein Slin15195_G100540 [Septoria linicola]